MISRAARCNARIAAIALGLIALTPSVGMGQAPAPPASGVPASPPIVNNTYVEHQAKTCANTTFCSINYTVVPASKLLIIHDVGCSIQLTNTRAVITDFFMNALTLMRATHYTTHSCRHRAHASSNTLKRRDPFRYCAPTRFRR